MSLIGADIRERIEAVLSSSDVSESEVNELLTDGYGYALSLDSERIRTERRITELAANAEDPEAAGELRRLWLRNRTIGGELSELRALLRRLREAQPAAS
jgi:hypothetical protein